MPNWGDFAIRFAIVTGAAAGIGAATARRLIAEGWFVFAFDVDTAALATLAAGLPGDRATTRVLDVRDHAAWTRAVAEVSAHTGGRLDLLVNNAGIHEYGWFRDVPAERKRQIVDVNVAGVINGIDACLPLLQATPAARIVNISSISALNGWPLAAVYSASKGAIYNLTEALAGELARHDIKVCDILPAFVDTGIFGSGEKRDALRRELRRLGMSFARPERVAQAVIDATRRHRLHRSAGSQVLAYMLAVRLFRPLVRYLCRVTAERVERASARQPAEACDLRPAVPSVADLDSP